MRLNYGYNSSQSPMTALRKALGIALLSGALLVCSGCKKSPTNAAFRVERPTIIVLCHPDSEAADALITAAIFIQGNTEEMRVFGLDISFDPQMLHFEEVRNGTLTGGWTAVDGNEVSPGSLKVGGFMGAGNPIPPASGGTVAEIRFKVAGGDSGSGQQSQVCARQYTDDLSDFLPESACAAFTLKK
jgi:hypothetical protein